MVNILTITSNHFVNIIISGALILELTQTILKSKIFNTPVFITLLIRSSIEILMNIILQVYPLTAFLYVYVIFRK